MHENEAWNGKLTFKNLFTVHMLSSNGPFYLLYGLENFSRSILFDEEFESALRFLKKSKAIFSVCDVITRKVYLRKVFDYVSNSVWRKREF